jgi:hypothetical protein
LEVFTMKGRTLLYLLLALCALLVLPSCGGGGGGSGTAQTGTLSVGLTDASTDEYKAVYVTITEVQVHMGGGAWKVVGSPNKTYNLLDLVNGVREELGVAELSAGNYTQMRLIIGDTSDGGINILSKQHPSANYVIDWNDVDHALKIPSGFQTGVKIVQGFTIRPNQTTELTLDFNASESVVVAGNSGQWLLKPTIKVLNTKECSIISGTVREGNRKLEGALVSAQIYTRSATDIKDEVVTEASTVTDGEGQYKIFVKPGTYNIVAYTIDYRPAVACAVELVSGVTETLDLPLTSGVTGTVSGGVTVAGAVEEQYATISFRQSAVCGQDPADDIEFEVKSLNVIDGGGYRLPLPAGTYEVVASSYEHPTLPQNLTIVSGVTTTVLDIHIQ